MLTFLHQSDIEALGDPYYAGRLTYFQAAARLCRQVPGSIKFTPSDVLEVGPYRLPLVPGCDVLDNADHGIPVTYKHDGSQTPWPISNKRYRLLVALQVWEHFQGRQQAAWREARRVADWVVLSVPYEWPDGTGEGHAHINKSTLRLWTGQFPIISIIVPSTIVPTMSRIVCLYDTRTTHNAAVTETD